MTGASRSPDSTRQLVLAVMAVVVVIAWGTLGYIVIEGWPPFDAFYMTVTTVTTVGYQEIHPLSPAGRAFTIVLIISGVGTLFYVLGNIARLLLEGELRDIFGRYRTEGKMKAVTNHYIVCGYGRMGKRICKELSAKPLPFVVIDKNPDVIAALQREGLMAVEGDATQDDVLIRAGIERAKGVVSVVNTDTENLYIVLTARGLKAERKLAEKFGIPVRFVLLHPEQPEDSPLRYETVDSEPEDPYVAQYFS